MASLSLPRVLQLKKNSLDAEREQFEKFQTLAIQKAINNIETPVKEKHVRSTIIGTFQEQSAITYWMVAVRLPLQDNRIVAWKFCHVTHKLLREGHPASLDDSQRHISMIENLGKLWVHLREGYGRLVHLYCNLLICKLKFHARNPRFPGNMLLTAEELDAIAENDVNNYFQLCVELFDYMDEILNLQASVFDSLGNARANSMTASGQCRLAALIPCAQDSSHIYDCNVRLLFRLHASLPADTLAGHRERFRQQFKKLSSFYKHASSLQYYRNLLTLPVLPSNPPNFLQQSDFGTYVAPVVTIPELPPDEVDAVGSLIDTSDTISLATTPDHFEDTRTVDTRATPSPQPDPVVERDRLIDHLQNELRRMRTEVSQLVQERNTMLGSMREHCTRLETQLHSAKTELEEERQKAEVLSAQTPEIKQKLTETEEKAKVSDEKFQKLKGAYTQLREEHIALIRQKAEVDKMSASLRAASAQHESAKMALQQQLNDRMKDVELLQQSASSSEEIEAYKSELSSLRTDLEQSRQKELELETLRASMEALEIEHKTATTEQQQKIETMSNELKEVTENLGKITKEKYEQETELSRVKDELTGLREKSGDEYKKVVEEKEAALKQVVELTQQHQQEKEEQVHNINNLQSELETLEIKLNDAESMCEIESDRLETLKVEFENVKTNSEKQIQEKECEITSLQDKINELIQSKDSNANVTKQLNTIIENNNKEIDELNLKLSEAVSALEKQKELFEELKKENDVKVTILTDKIETVTNCKDDIIKSLKDLITEKDEQVISLNVEMNKQSGDISRLEDELKEAQAELEIGQNEIMTLRDEHDNFVDRNESNLTLKNQELRTLHEEIIKLSQEKSELVAEKEKLLDEFNVEKEVLENKVKEMDEACNRTKNENGAILHARKELVRQVFEAITEIKAECQTLKEDNANELKILADQIMDVFNKQLCERDINATENHRTIEKLTSQLDELQTLKAKENEEMIEIQSKKDSELQILEARLEHTETERLNAECELQDLLQHNTVMEADLNAARKQLEEARRELDKQSARLVSCAGETALDVTNEALAALERSNAQDTNRAAAELAAQVLDDLARQTELKGNEEAVARSAILAAHNTATLSAYVTEVCNISTDMELSDKLSNQCRTMLSSTKQCLEALKNGSLPSSCPEARTHVLGMLQAASAADRVNTGTRSVDDELADMDRAIEQAASQIEELLAASKAGDSGIKLEVNGKILDACTTLMAAVKMLVQDARKLQSELGDPKTRQKMYRRNPQWSEGLISAAKAVVFAAKLLVTSADEAVGASGRVEGVSAAAHEVAGSTAQLVAASRARAPPSSPALARLTRASRSVAAATGALVAAVRAAGALVHEQEALDTTALTLTATRRLEMESKVRSLELESALDAERARLAALRKRHYHLAQLEENGNMTNGKE